MAFINFYRYKRNELTSIQKDFLHVLIPFGRIVQEYTKKKCLLAGIRSKDGVKASLVCADAILKSGWGTHKMAKKYNNLNLLEANEFWYGKSKDCDGRLFRAYECWFDYAADLSDHYVFSGNYLSVLLSKNLDEQIDSLAASNLQSVTECGKIEALIRDLGLFEFDL